MYKTQIIGVGLHFEGGVDNPTIELAVMNIKFSACLLMLITCLASLQGLLQAQENSDPYKLPDDLELSFTKDVQPILNAKCVACHACYDAPAQLDLRNAKGVQRGAIKLDPYSVRETPIESTVLAFNPKTIEDWRQRGFFRSSRGGKTRCWER